MNSPTDTSLPSAQTQNPASSEEAEELAIVIVAFTSAYLDDVDRYNVLREEEHNSPPTCGEAPPEQVN
jgi:hypothetical protein